MGEETHPPGSARGSPPQRVPNRPNPKSHRGERGVSHHPYISEAPRALRPRRSFAPRQANPGTARPPVSSARP